jgi:hypothetical protein
MSSASTIDFTDIGGLSALPFNVELNALVERSTATRAKMPRPYLGASIVGHECARQVQYAWWCLPELPARMRLIFDRGHAFEALARAQLIQAGFAFVPAETLEFVALNDCLKGHADGVVIHARKTPGVYLPHPCVWECKALNSKNWRAVNKDGFAKTFPKYAVQVSLYQHFLNKLNPALVTCVNSDTCEVLHLALPFDAERAEQAIARAETIIAATRAGELLPRAYDNPQDWRCQICAHRARCWGAAA